MILLAVAVVAVLIGAATITLNTPGRTRLSTIGRRYGFGWVIAVSSAPAAVVSLVVWPAQTAIALASSTASALVILLAMVAARGHLEPLAFVNFARRVRFKLLWPSVARSAGLAVSRDRRPPAILGGSARSPLSELVEWLPELSHGRRFSPGSTTYRLTPARGSTIEAVADAHEAIAASVGAHRVEVERLSPSVGGLTVVWTPAYTETALAPDHVDR